MENVKWIGCDPANFATGRNGRTVCGIVIHLTDGHKLTGTDAWFAESPTKRGPGSMASSAHYGIDRDGTIHQYVKEQDRAYHAGRVEAPTVNVVKFLAAQGSHNPNDITIGIEHAGVQTDDWTDETLNASASLIADICTRYKIPCDRQHIFRHHEIFLPKPCPGAKCPLDDIVTKAAALIKV